MTLDEIGVGSAALFCLTNKTDCCRSSDTPEGVRGIGHWVLPDESTVPGFTDMSKNRYYRTRDPSAVKLNRPEREQTTGLFRCRISDASNTTRELTVGVYSHEEGRVVNSVCSQQNIPIHTITLQVLQM